MLQLRDMFARHDLDVGLYYLRRGAWVAAANRAQHVLETYPGSSLQDDAVALMGEAYERLGNETLAADARRVLEKNNPAHPWQRGEWPDYPSRSEERRVGKEGVSRCRYRWSQYPSKKKKPH